MITPSSLLAAVTIALMKSAMRKRGRIASGKRDLERRGFLSQAEVQRRVAIEMAITLLIITPSDGHLKDSHQTHKCDTCEGLEEQRLMTGRSRAFWRIIDYSTATIPSTAGAGPVVVRVCCRTPGISIPGPNGTVNREALIIPASLSQFQTLPRRRSGDSGNWCQRSQRRYM